VGGTGESGTRPRQTGEKGKEKEKVILKERRDGKATPLVPPCAAEEKEHPARGGVIL